MKRHEAELEIAIEVRVGHGHPVKRATRIVKLDNPMTQAQCSELCDGLRLVVERWQEAAR